MEKRAIDVAKALVRLSEVTIFELRGEWRRLHRMLPPMRLPRDLLIRGIIYQLQERAYGGLSKAAARKLEQAAAGPPSRGAANPTASVSLRPGTRLVREWHDGDAIAPLDLEAHPLDAALRNAFQLSERWLAAPSSGTAWARHF